MPRYRLRTLLSWLLGSFPPRAEAQQPTWTIAASLSDRFTDRARRVLLLANEESQRLNNEFVGTEHLLLGLLKEGSGVAAYVLHKMDGDRIQKALGSCIISGTEKPTPVGRRPLTPCAYRAIDYAREEARNLNHHFVSTEHLLLGLLRESGSVPAQVLLALGIEPASIRREVLSVLGIR